MPIYEYEGKHYELPAGMSNEQAIAEIEAHLGKTAAPAPEAPKDPEHSKALEAYGTFMRPLIKGLSAPVNLVADGVAATGNVAAMLAGSDMRFPLLSQLQDASLDAREYKGQKVYPRSDNPLVKAGQDAVEGTVGALATGPAMASREMVNTVPKMVATAAGSVAAPPVAEKVAKVTGYDALGQLAGMATGAAVGGAAGKATAAATTKPSYMSLQEIRDAASKAYQTVDNSGLTVKRSTANTMINDIQQELAKERFDPRLNPKVATTMDVIREIAGKPLSLSKLDDLRKRAGDLLASQDANERRLGRVIINGIDDKVSNLTPNDFYTGGNTAPDAALKALTEARTLTRNRARAEILDDAMTKAEVKAQMPNASEGELLRKAFNNIEADPKKFAQFNEQEQNVIKAINRGGPIDKGLSFLARFNPARSQFMAATLSASGAGGYAAGKPGVSVAAGATALTGFGADNLQGVLRSRAAQHAVDQISNARFDPPSQGYSPQGLFGGGITAQDELEMQRLFGQ